MNLEAKAATEDAAYDHKPAQLGIPIIYVDFREDPHPEHTIPSMRIMGQVMNDEAAEEFIDFAEAQLAWVTLMPSHQANPSAPASLSTARAATRMSAGMSFGPVIGQYVTLAGGTNIADGIIPAVWATKPSRSLLANPDHVVVTVELERHATRCW